MPALILFRVVAKVRDLDLSTSEVAVLFALASFAGDGTKPCFPSISTLCAISKLTNKPVYLAIRKLESMGIISTVKTAGRPTRYTFLEGWDNPNQASQIEVKNTSVETLKNDQKLVEQIHQWSESTSGATPREGWSYSTGVVELLHGGGGATPPEQINEQINEQITEQKITRDEVALSQNDPVKNLQLPLVLEPEEVKPEKKRKEGKPSKSSNRFVLVDKPAHVSDQVWEDFGLLRKAKRAPLTPTALRTIEESAKESGYTLEEALAICNANGWQGFKGDWVKKKYGSAKKGTPSNSHPEVKPRGADYQHETRWDKNTEGEGVVKDEDIPF